MQTSNLRSLSQGTKAIKPQRLAVKPSKSIFMKKEDMYKTEQIKFSKLDEKIAEKRQTALLNTTKDPAKVSQKVLRTKLEPLNPNYVSKSSKLLYDELFVKKLTGNSMLPLAAEVGSGKKQETPSGQEFDEGLKTLKEVTRKEKYYEIYEIMKNKRGIKSHTNMLGENAIFGGLSTLNFTQTKMVEQPSAKHRTTFDNMIVMDVPSVITLGKSQLSHHQLNVSTSAPDILNSFQKRDVVLRLNTNALDKEDSHQYQAYLYLGNNCENQFQYEKVS